MSLYEIKVSYLRQTGDSRSGKVKETYLVEGFSCSDVEDRLIESIQSLVSSEFEVIDCKRVKYYDVVMGEGDCWYKFRVELIVDNKDGKERRKTVTLLIEAADLDDAVLRLKKQLSVLDYEIISATKSSIIELISMDNGGGKK